MPPAAAVPVLPLLFAFSETVEGQSAQQIFQAFGGEDDPVVLGAEVGAILVVVLIGTWMFVTKVIPLHGDAQRPAA
jgi:hypothetical protein